MPKRMLIDATHPEETRVIVADGKNLLEYDYETSTKRQIKSNIYLAKVTRVEPSLQAAFVDFGGNRHGFLAFNEIHPDYYQIPVEDREKLLAETEVAESEDEDDDDLIEASAEDAEDEATAEDADGGEAAETDAEADAERDGEENGEEGVIDEDGDENMPASPDASAAQDNQGIETFADANDEDIQELDDARRRRLRKLTRSYKIQEVIKRRQILLVQVVKEERGNKGAALTTYLSLPGRYCVLMPNTSRGGGISRKITDPKHRKAMKKTLSEMEVPDGMAVIMRTAGVERTKAEIKRDYEYLRRVWDDIRALTMNSTAPSLIYEEGDVIKRALRDIYDRDIEEVLVEGEEAYKHAKTLMRTMIPSHAKRVQKYDDTAIPLFNRYQVDQQLDEIHDPVVQLKSGGYLVINPTEALVAIDVNSGRATRERNVEQTALRTNLEAAEEVARQLKLRDLAGLIVIDFIDMDVSRNNHAVERKLKESMKTDRARIQIGRISPFGLLELSRQRLRPSIHEAHTQTCPVCKGAGFVRSTASTAMSILRELEEEGLRNRAKDVTVTAHPDIALYLLNQKRDALREIEERHDMRVIVIADPDMTPSEYATDFTRSKPGGDQGDKAKCVKRDQETRDEDGGSRRRRRRGRKRQEEDSDDAEELETEDVVEAEGEGEDADETEDGEGRRRGGRRRGRRGGRRRRRSGEARENEDLGEDSAEAPEDETESSNADELDDQRNGEHEDGEGSGTRRRRRRGRRGRGRAASDENAESSEDFSDAVGRAETVENFDDDEVDREIDIPEPRSTSERDNADDADPDNSEDDIAEAAEAEHVGADDSDEAEPDADDDNDNNRADEKVVAEEEDDSRPRRSGWWNRAAS
jgi:ribonuclease E